MDLDVVDPTRRGQDLFVLSKGHAVAALASIYADLGYFDRSVLRNSRSYESILNGHPGPLLPGVQVATGPMGQGFAVAQGFAIAGRTSPRFDVYCLTGDGELQEGPIWEAVMYAGQKHLDNLCVMVDRNNGQLDLANRMVFPMPDLERVFASFDWDVHSVDATQYDGVYAALEQFRFGPRNGKTHGDHLSRDEGPRRAVRFPEQAQGHGTGRARRTGARAAGRAAPGSRRRVQPVPARHRRPAGPADARRSRPSDAPRCQPSAVRRFVPRAQPRPGADQARAEAGQEGQVRPRAPSTSRRREGVRGERHRDRGDESVRAGLIGRLDRRGPRDDERSRGGRRGGRSAPRAQRRRRRSEHDGNRRGVRRARVSDLGQHVLSVLRLEGDAPHRRRPPGAARNDWRARRLAQRRPWSRSDDARDGGELRDPDERRDAHGQRRLRRSSTASHICRSSMSPVRSRCCP